jgi:cysteine desulfurase/selenocysteine lyase
MTTRSDIALPGNPTTALPGQVDDATLDRIAGSLQAAIPGANGPEAAIAAATAGSGTPSLGAAAPPGLPTPPGPESATAAALAGSRTTSPGAASSYGVPSTPVIGPEAAVAAAIAGSRTTSPETATPYWLPSPPAINALVPGLPGLGLPVTDAVIGRIPVPTPNSAAAAALQEAVPLTTSGEVWPAGLPDRARLPLNLQNIDGSLPRMFDAPAASRLPAPSDGAPSYYFLTPALATPPARPGPQLSRRPFEVNEIRRDFPILEERAHGKRLVWLDNAATTQKPNAVIQRLVHYYEHEYSNVHRGAHTLAARSTDAYESAREKLQRFIGAGSPSEIIFVRGTTEGVNLVAASFGRKFIGEGDEIVLSTLEHHSNIVPWQFLAKQVGAVIRVIPVTDRGEVLLGDFERTLSTRTRFVALTHVSNALGTVLPVGEMIQMAHRRGAHVLIDGAQAVSHFPVNVQNLDADFYVLSGHKMFGPSAIGVVYGKKALLDEMPPWQGGGNMIQRVTFENSTFAEPPGRFEAGTAALGPAVGLGAAADYLERIGMENVARYEHELLLYATEKLSKIPGVRLIGTAPEKAGVVSFITDEIPAEEMGKILDQDGIAVRAGHHCAQPTMDRFGLEATVRPSLALYNTHDEIDQLERSVRRALRR